MIDGMADSAEEQLPNRTFAATRPPVIDNATIYTVFGVATAEPYGATRWRFDR